MPNQVIPFSQNQTENQTENYQIIPFEYKQKEIRVYIDEYGNPWWIAKDICIILEYSKDISNILKILDEDEKVIRKIFVSEGKVRKMWTINESGLYALIFNSKKPEAKKFSKWVRTEVLPSIRKTGSYTMPRNQYLMPEIVPTDDMLLNMFQGMVSLRMEQIKDQEEIKKQSDKINEHDNKLNEHDNKLKVTRIKIDRMDRERKRAEEQLADFEEPTVKVKKESLRQKINRIVKKYCLAKKVYHPYVWGELYRIFNSRMHMNVNVLAKNKSKKTGKKVSKLDIIEEKGLLKEFYTVAHDLFVKKIEELD